MQKPEIKLEIPSVFRDCLLDWFRSSRRDLPWRRTRDPYRIWISEVMLQQTRIEAVKEYYRRFLAELPDVFSLAAVPVDKLMKLWQGLGYYSRAANLRKAANIIIRDFNGLFPEDPDKLRKLPGIGEYTAGAIASIAFHKPAPAVDGNVVRVLARYLGNGVDTPDFRRSLSNALIPIYPPEGSSDCSSFTQSIMELGETLCIPNGVPLCEKCPLRHFCIAAKDGRTAELPVKIAKSERKTLELTVLLLFNESGIYLKKRPDKGLLAGLWELPNQAGCRTKKEILAELNASGFQTEKMKKLPVTTHIFTHIQWNMTPWSVKVSGTPAVSSFVLAPWEKLKTDFPIPNAFGKLLKRTVFPDLPHSL